MSVLASFQDERSRLMRRTVMRYVNLAQLLTLIMISPTVKKRFPTHDHIVESGFCHLNYNTAMRPRYHWTTCKRNIILHFSSIIFL
ncbi:hypothetical protein SK128_013259 [Halocaridina rubra]|uniref:Bestrophin homolog n=1 Tax=Halocaridina rubra TaxID=373956 RepID=A0AAN9ACQ3_HALRR